MLKQGEINSGAVIHLLAYQMVIHHISNCASVLFTSTVLHRGDLVEIEYVCMHTNMCIKMCIK